MATVERRQVLKGATILGAGAVAVPLLAACGGGSSSGAAASAPAGGSTTADTSSAAPAGSSSAAAASSSAPAAKGITVAKSKVPVGGGVVDGSVVVTQPTSGDFKAYTSTCTHMQCTVGGVQDGFIVCPCHGSMFAIATGVPTSASPAKKPLAAKTVTPSGDNLIIGT